MNEKKYRGTYHEYTDSTDVGADKTLMTAESLKVVNKGKELWQQGNETGDQALMDQGHAMAEAERAKYGYSGGANGGAYNPFELDQGSAKGSSASSASSYTTSPTWSAPYERQQRSAVRKIESQEPFSYAPETDPTYQQYRDTYTRMGEKARDDTIGVLRSRGGGQVSSYAAIAAQQAEEAYMQELADKVPELRQLAYQMWLDEGDRARSDLRMYDALNSSDAARWGATVLDPYLQDRSYAFDREQYQDSKAYRDKVFDYNAELDAEDRAYRDKAFDYNAGLDAEDRAYRDKLFDYQVEQDKLARERLAEQDITTLERAMAQAAQRGESIQELMNDVWRSGYYSDEEKERLKAYAQSLGYTVTEG